jgi:hypothetical protein
MRRSVEAFFAFSLVLLLSTPVCVSATAEYPPVTRLKNQVLVAERPARASPTGTTATSGITRGYEAIYFSVESRGKLNRVVYDTAQKKIIPVDADPARSAAKPIDLSDSWDGIARWRRHFERAERPDLLTIEHLEQGFGCRAQPGRGPGEAAEIILERQEAGKTTRLCALEPYQNRVLHGVCWLRMMPSGDIAVLTGDAGQNALYVRRGYSRRHYGPLVWYRLKLDEQGGLAGKPQVFPFPEGQHPAEVLIGAVGTLFGVVPDLELLATFQQKRRARESTDDITPTCYAYRVDPELRKAERTATITGTWDIRWAPWQHGKPVAIGIGDDAFYRIDLKTGVVRRSVKRPEIRALEIGSYVLHDGKMYLMPRVQAENRIAGRTMALYSVDLTSGETLYYGLIVGSQGRRPKDLNRFTFLPDGRIFTSGTVYGSSTDRNYMPRYRNSEAYRLDCAAFVIDKLPPGKPFEPQSDTKGR